MVLAPEHYQWTSHRAYIGEESIPWLTTDWILSQFGKHKKRARQRFHEFCLTGIHEKYRQEFHKGTFEGRILGNDQFSENVLARAEERFHPALSVEQFINIVCKQYKLDKRTIVEQPAAETRAVVSYLVQNAEKLFNDRISARTKTRIFCSDQGRRKF